MKRRDVAIDIESLAIPENSGYDIVIPNYALVKVPEVPETYQLDWMYVQMPLQPQIDKGLKMSASCMSFWFDMCAEEYPRALQEMKKSFLLDTVELKLSSQPYVTHKIEDPSIVVNGFLNGEYGEYDGKIWGNGCHFDCSILQANHRIMYNNGNMWKYSAPQNARSLKDLLSDAEREEMDSIVTDYLGRFEITTRVEHGIVNLQLHHPLYDAAREALQISYCRQKKNG